MITDPVADFLTRIRNASASGQEQTLSPYSTLRHRIAEILKAEGYIKDVTVVETENQHKKLAVTLAYQESNTYQQSPRVRRIRRVSRPGQRVYVNRQNIPRPLRGLGTVILSTSGGVLSGQEARKKGLGGELICEIW